MMKAGKIPAALCLAALFGLLMPCTAKAEGITAVSDISVKSGSVYVREVDTDAGVQWNWPANTYLKSTKQEEETDTALNEDITDLTDSLLEQLDFDEIDHLLSENGNADVDSFSDIVRSLLDSESEDAKSEVGKEILSLVFSEAAEYRILMMRLMILTLAFAFFNSFISASPDSTISKTGFYLYFLVLMALLMESYLVVSGIFTEVMECAAEMMGALIPAFAMTLVFASAQTTAAAFYQIAVAVIWLVERLLLAVVAPAVHIYMVLQILNCFTGEKMISRLTVLIRKLILWTLRALLAGVTGINVIEAMIAPSLDNLKKVSVTKALGMIPGLGNVTEAVSNLFLGSALVIKNGVGAAAMIALLSVVFAPVVRMLVFLLMYKAAGAIVQPFAGPQVSGCIDSVGESASLLLRTLLVGTLLFLITIALVITAVR